MDERVERWGQENCPFFLMRITVERWSAFALRVHVAAEVHWIRKPWRQAVEDGRNGGEAEQGEVHRGVLELSDGEYSEAVEQPMADQDDEVPEKISLQSRLVLMRTPSQKLRPDHQSWYLRHGISATAGFYSISSIVSHVTDGKALPSFLEAPKNQALGRLVQLVGKVGRRWNDRQDQDNVRVGSVDEASADGVNHAQDGQEVERSVDGWATSARQELGGQPRADAEHQEGAKAVEDENLEKVGWCGSKVCSYLTASNKVFFNKILTKHQNYRVMVVLMPSLSSSSYIKSSRSMMEQL